MPTNTEPRIITTAPHGHILANAGVWSPDGEWIVYDVRSDPAGSVFDGTRIEKVHVRTGEVRVLYESRNGACCGIPTFHPTFNRIVFTLGPENPTADWRYAANRRQAVVLDEETGCVSNLDARDLTPPFTPGALRGGTHLHTFSPDARFVAFTYEDAVLEPNTIETDALEINQRIVGVSLFGKPVRVPQTHPRNHNGDAFSVLVTRTTGRPRFGSDDITRACEEAWIGTDGYLRPDGTRQRHALAFQGSVVTADGRTISEVFIADLPDDLTRPGDGPLQGTATTRPRPPLGVQQRRLTFTDRWRYAGLQGPRHWLRSAPDGSLIAFLMRDEMGVVQLWRVSPNGGEPRQVTRNPWDISSAFTWTPDGRWIAHAADNSICLTDIASGETRRLTARSADESAPRPEASVVSPDGGWLAFVRPVQAGAVKWNQLAVVACR